ncbi:MAG: type VII toxin-antitoxin system HepT family RNase toxin [Acidimicrobiales bacterium]
MQQRLRLLDDTLSELDQVGVLTAEELDADAIRRAATERLIQVVVDLAVDINAHVVVATTGRAPDTARRSFLAMGSSGILPVDLAERLAPSAGLRNVLVHRYRDIRLDLLADALQRIPGDYREYTRRLASWLESAQ